MRIKLLHLGCAFYPYRGGSAVRLGNLIANCSSTESHVITHTLEEDRDLHSAASIHRMKYFSLVSLGKIRRLVRSTNPEIVVLHNLRVALLWILFVDPFRRVKQLAEIHSFLDEHILKQILSGFVYRRMDGVVVLSNTSKQTAVQDYKLVPSKVHVVMNGRPVQTPEPEPDSSQLSHTNPKVLFGYIGTLYDWQGVITLAQAAHLAPISFWDTSRLIIAGGGPAETVVRELISDLLLKDLVELPGWIASDEAFSLLYRCDIILMPRLSTKGTENVVPLKIFEAMTAGKAIIASSVGGLTEILEDRVTALVVPPDNPMQLLRAMTELVEDIELRTRLGLTAQQSVRQYNTWLDAGAKYENVYASLLMPRTLNHDDSGSLT